MNQEIEPKKDNQPEKQPPPEINLSDLIKMAEPLIRDWTTNDNEKHKREIEFERELLQSSERQNKLMIIGFFSILILTFIISGILFIVGKDSTAMGLLSFVFSIGGTGFGAWGWSKYAHKKSED